MCGIRELYCFLNVHEVQKRYTPDLMSLYRQYRPKIFADVVGQDHVVSTLEQAIKQDKISHAYLFSGPRGTGKTTLARILATELVTKNVTDAAQRQKLAEGVEDGSLVDVIEIDAASNTGVDTIRELIEKIQFSPIVAAAKVYIIDEVHMLSKGAFNALLKTLEEPPSYAYFILATTELHKVPATIQSRCQRFQLKQVEEEGIIRRLQFVADQEHISVERPALRAIAHHVQGGMRDALALLDQLRALPAITLADVQDRIGETGHELANELLAAIDAADESAVLGITRRIEEQAIPYENIIRTLLSTLRTQLHQAIDAKQPTAVLLHRLDTLLGALRSIRLSPLPVLVLESSLLSLIRGNEAPTPSANSFVPPPAPNVNKPAAPVTHREPVAPKVAAKEPEKSGAVEVPALDIHTLRSLWNEILKTIEPPSVRMSLKDASVQSIDGNTLTLVFSSNFHKSKVSAIEASRAIEEHLLQRFGVPVKLKCTLEEGTTPVQDKEMVDLASAAAEIF